MRWKFSTFEVESFIMTKYSAGNDEINRRLRGLLSVESRYYAMVLVFVVQNGGIKMCLKLLDSWFFISQSCFYTQL